MRALVAFGGCLVVGLVLYPALIGVLASRRAGQRVSEYVPAGHQRKVGTPTMGGLLFCLLTVAAWLALDRSRGGFRRGHRVPTTWRVRPRCMTRQGRRRRLSG